MPQLFELNTKCDYCNNKIRVDLDTPNINTNGILRIPNGAPKNYYIDKHYNFFCPTCIKNELPKHTKLMQNSLKKHIKKHDCSVFAFEAENIENIHYIRDPDLLTLELIEDLHDFRSNVKYWWTFRGTRVYTKFKYDGKTVVFWPELHLYDDFFYPNTFVKIKTTNRYSRFFRYNLTIDYYNQYYNECKSLFTTEELKKMNYILLKNEI